MLDVLGHLIYAFVVLLPASRGHVWLSAILLGLIRELEQMRASGDWNLGMNRLVDIAGFAAAGIALQILGCAR
jgi:hypothetical protein